MKNMKTKNQQGKNSTFTTFFRSAKAAFIGNKKESNNFEFQHEYAYLL